MRIHESLEMNDSGDESIRCLRCGHVFCEKGGNYKEHSLIIKDKLSDMRLRYLNSGEDTFVIYYQYICPGCGILLEVDSVCPELNSDDPVVFDIELRSR